MVHIEEFNLFNKEINWLPEIIANFLSFRPSGVDPVSQLVQHSTC